MPGYPRPRTGGQILIDHEQRLRRLEAQMTQVRNQTGAASGAAAFDANRLTNGGFESGPTGWRATFSSSGHGDASQQYTDTSNPIDGQRSMRVDEPAWHWTLMGWNPNSPPQPGVDAFATSPGDVWRLQAKVRPTYTAESNGQVRPTVWMIAAIAPVYVYENQDNVNNKWVQAATLPAASDQVVTLDGLATVPGGFNYVGFLVSGDDGNHYPVNTAWTWTVDSCSMQRRLS